MLKKDELYTNEISVTEANSIYSDENRVKILLIFTLFFMILILGYLIYGSKDNGNIIKGTRVLGVSYIPQKNSEKDKLTKNPTVQYNDKSNMSNIDDKDEYEDIVMVDDKDEYRDATVVDDKDKYAKIGTVKNPI